jgi:hypothetical protein
MENGPYYGWPKTGVNSLTSPSGWQYSNLSRYVDEEVPINGIDIFGARFGQGHLNGNTSGQHWQQVSQMPNSMEIPDRQLQDTRYLPMSAMASPIGGLALDSPRPTKERLDPVREGYQRQCPAQGRENFERENFVQVDLTRNDSVPPDALEPTVKRTRESTHTGWREPQYDQYRNPMAKACSDIDWKNSYPFWPLDYEYPYRDPLYDILTTKFYTASNADPENLSEMRLWPTAY